MKNRITSTINAWSTKALRLNLETLQLNRHIGDITPEERILTFGYLQALCQSTKQHRHIYPHRFTITRPENRDEVRSMYLVALVEASNRMESLINDEWSPETVADERRWGSVLADHWVREYKVKDTGETVTQVVNLKPLTDEGFSTLLWHTVNQAQRLYVNAIKVFERQTSTWQSEIDAQVESSKWRHDDETVGWDNTLKLACDITGSTAGTAVTDLVNELSTILTPSQVEYLTKRMFGMKADDSKARKRTADALLREGIVAYNTMYNRYYI